MNILALFNNYNPVLTKLKTKDTEGKQVTYKDHKLVTMWIFILNTETLFFTLQ